MNAPCQIGPTAGLRGGAFHWPRRSQWPNQLRPDRRRLRVEIPGRTTKIVGNSGNRQSVLITWPWIEWNSINSDAALRFSVRLISEIGRSPAGHPPDGVYEIKSINYDNVQNSQLSPLVLPESVRVCDESIFWGRLRDRILKGGKPANLLKSLDMTPTVVLMLSELACGADNLFHVRLSTRPRGSMPSRGPFLGGVARERT